MQYSFAVTDPRRSFQATPAFFFLPQRRPDLLRHLQRQRYKLSGSGTGGGYGKRQRAALKEWGMGIGSDDRLTAFTYRRTIVVYKFIFPAMRFVASCDFVFVLFIL